MTREGRSVLEPRFYGECRVNQDLGSAALKVTTSGTPRPMRRPGYQATPQPDLQLTEDEVVRPEYLPEGPRAHGVHGARLQIHEHGAGHVLATCGAGGRQRREGRGAAGGWGKGAGVSPVASL